MKKSLIALAVAGAFAAPAYAATSNVDIYGLLTVSVDFIDTDNSTPEDSITRVSSNSSRIGFKGSEDLGGGLSAIWQIESQLNVDGGTGIDSGAGAVTAGGNFSSALRNTFLGVKSDSMGTVLLGRHDTPYKLATGKLDIFSDTAGDYNNIVGNANGTNAFDLRTSNVIAYISPTFSGFHAAVAYVAGNENGVAADFDALSAMGMYENGPLFASVAYETHNNYDAIGAFDRNAWKAGLGYKFGDAQVGFVYEHADDDAPASATSRDAWYLNGQYTMGPIVLKAAYGKADDGDSAANTEADTWVLGVDYVLSKRTKVYALYAQANNDGTGATGIGAGQGSAFNSAGAEPSVFSIGVRHAF